MDSSLLRERELFKKKAVSIPTVEKRKNTTEPNDQCSSKKRKLNEPAKKHHNFEALAKIVKYLRARYLGGNKNPVSLEEILKETKQSDINPNVKSWLLDDALKENPKIKVVQGQLFVYKATYKLDSCPALGKLLKKHESSGLGGVLWDDVVESLPKAEIILDVLKKRNIVSVITRSTDKKKVLFCHESSAALKIDEDLKKLWNKVTVDVPDNSKLINYLDQNGISSMKSKDLKRPMPSKIKQKGKKKLTSEFKDNLHVADILDTYDDKTLTQKPL